MLKKIFILLSLFLFSCEDDPVSSSNAIESKLYVCDQGSDRVVILDSSTDQLNELLVVDINFSETDDDMEVQIQIEADQHIPFPLDQVSIDFEVVEEPEEDSENVKVLLAAARSEIVDNCVASLDLGGLKAKVVDIEAFTIENSIEWISKK